MCKRGRRHRVLSPLSAEQPEVALKSMSLEVMTLAVSSARLSENQLRLAAEELRDGLLQLPSISFVFCR